MSTRRYGRAQIRHLRPQVGPTGAAIWSVRGQRYYWNGPGSRLKLLFGEHLVAIDHPRADGVYKTRREAEEALRAFVDCLV